MKKLILFMIVLAATMFAHGQIVPPHLEVNLSHEEITCCFEGEKEPIICGMNRLTLGEPPAGSGTPEDPFLVVNSYNLIWIYENPLHWDKNYLQMENIDATEPDSWFGGMGWIPLGTEENPFSGIYDGNGKIISGLKIDRYALQYQGFIGYNNGIIKNLGIVDAHITDNGSRAGILVGLNDTGFISHCFSTGIIESSHDDGRIGGLVGWNNNSITHSWSSAEVHCSNGIYVGGLAGANNGGTIINCYATGNVNGLISVGGLVGVIQNSGLVENCFASGNILAHRLGGGLAGYSLSNSTILNCYASGRVDLDLWGGGLVGAMASGSISNSYGLGKISSFYNHDHMLGGLLGNEEDVNITSSFWNVESSAHLTSHGGTPAVTQQMITQAFYDGWDFENTWQIIENESYPYFIYQENPMDCNYPPLVLTPGSFTATPDDNQILLEWQVPSMGQHLGFMLYRDDTLIQVLNPSSVHYLDESVENLQYYTYQISAIYATNEASLPLKLKAFPTPGIAVGDGSETNPYQISDMIELFTVRQEPAAHYIQVQDIDLSFPRFDKYEGWIPIGDYILPFTGKYDGGGFTIRNLYANKPDDGYYLGLFGQISDATITNVHLVDVDITSYAISGGLAGSAYLSQVSACSVTGNILTGSIHAGGLIGMVSESEIHGCYSNVTVSCLINDAGGLLGWQNGGVTENCYATGIISGNNYSGGLIGNISSQAIIKNSYAKGVVGGNYIKSGLVGFGDGTQLVENSYWDIETSGTETSAGGVGMNTQEMLMQESFENWDFEFTWKIEEYKTYPYLAWQQSPGEHNVSTGWYLLSGRVYPHGAGTVTGAGIYTAGQHVMVSASAFDGFVFEKWVDFEGSYITDQSEFYFIMPDQHVLFSAIFSIVSATDQWAGTNPFIFPNPFSDIITIENVTAVKQVVMTNIYGQVVLQKYLNGSESDSFQTRDLPSGVYMVFLLNENNTPKAVKMIKW